MPKNSSDENFRPFCAFIDFLQMFKVGKFASFDSFDDTKMQNSRIARICAPWYIRTLKIVWAKGLSSIFYGGMHDLSGISVWSQIPKHIFSKL